MFTEVCCSGKYRTFLKQLYILVELDDDCLKELNRHISLLKLIKFSNFNNTTTINCF